MIEYFTLNPGRSSRKVRYGEAASAKRRSSSKGWHRKRATSLRSIGMMAKKANPKKKAAKIAPKKTTARRKTITKRRNQMARNTGWTKAKRRAAGRKAAATRRRTARNKWTRAKSYRGKAGHRIATTLGAARRKAPRKPLKYLKKKGVSARDFLGYRRMHPFSKAAFARPTKLAPRKRKAYIRVGRGKIAANVGGSQWRHLVRYKARKVGGRRGMKSAAATWRKLKKGGRMPTMKSMRRRYPLARRAAANPAPNRRRSPKRRKTRRNRATYQIAPVLANKRRKTRRNRAPYQIAPVLANRYQLPYQFAMNPMSAVMEFPKRVLALDFLKTEVLPVVGGAIGSKIAAAQLAKLILGYEKNPARYARFFADAGWKKALWEGGAGIALGTGVGLASRGKYTDIAMKVAAGGLLAALLTIFETSGHFEKVREWAGVEGMGSFGQNVEAELKEKIAAELETELEGVSDFVTVEELPEEGVAGATMAGFVTAEDLPGEQPITTMDSWGGNPTI